jgi:hypothetical protein
MARANLAASGMMISASIELLLNAFACIGNVLRALRRQEAEAASEAEAALLSAESAAAAEELASFNLSGGGGGSTLGLSFSLSSIWEMMNFKIVSVGVLSVLERSDMVCYIFKRTFPEEALEGLVDVGDIGIVRLVSKYIISKII